MKDWNQVMAEFDETIRRKEALHKLQLEAEQMRAQGMKNHKRAKTRKQAKAIEYWEGFSRACAIFKLSIDTYQRMEKEKNNGRPVIGT